MHRRPDGYARFAIICVWVCSLGLPLMLAVIGLQAWERRDGVGLLIGLVLAPLMLFMWARFSRWTWRTVR